MSAEVFNSVVLKAGWSVISDRFYPIAALRMLVDQFKPGLGTFEMVTDDATDGHWDSINLDKASHWCERLYLTNRESELWVEAKPLMTPRGKLLRDYLKTKDATFSLRMMGSVNKYNEVNPDSVKFIQVCAQYNASDAFRKAKKRGSL